MSHSVTVVPLQPPAGPLRTGWSAGIDQDWCLRVTALRRDGGRRRIAHRQTDPLVHPIPLEHLAQLARGLGG